jgi:hypothetical protein
MRRRLASLIQNYGSNELSQRVERELGISGPWSTNRSWYELLEKWNVHYRVDTQGGVHFYFDKEFAHNQAATVAVLKGSRYANTLRSFEGALA